MGLWTPEHTATLLPALAVMIILTLILRAVLRGRTPEQRMLPVKIIACLLLLLEVGKQLLSLYRGYDLYHLPFHFCSLYIFMLPLMAFYRGKYKNAVSAITAAISASLFLLMLIYPNLIYSAGNIQAFFTDYFSFHTVAFHNLVMLAFLLIVALQLHIPQPKGEQKPVILFTLGFCTVSATMAQLLKTNYANYYSCNIPVFETLRLSLQGTLGYGVTQLLYVLIVSALNVGFVLMSYWLCRLLLKLASKKQAPAATTV